MTQRMLRKSQASPRRSAPSCLAHLLFLVTWNLRTGCALETSSCSTSSLDRGKQAWSGTCPRPHSQWLEPVHSDLQLGASFLLLGQLDPQEVCTSLDFAAQKSRPSGSLYLFPIDRMGDQALQGW